MSVHIRHRAVVGALATLMTALVTVILAVPVASAATAPPTPESLTSCTGSLSADPSGPSSGEPDLLDYSFSCDTAISAYTVIVDRVSRSDGNLDDYNPNPIVYEADDATPSATETVTCEGTTPSSGINCNLGAGGSLNQGYFVQGSVDPTEPYCSYLPAHAKAGTPAVPAAIVQLIVTDATGAQDGPFDLAPTKACKKVPRVVPAPKVKTGKKKSSRQARRAHRAAGTLDRRRLARG